MIPLREFAAWMLCGACFFAWAYAAHELGTARDDVARKEQQVERCMTTTARELDVLERQFVAYETIRAVLYATPLGTPVRSVADREVER